MSYATRMTTEINEQLDLLAQSGTEWNATWVAQAICQKHAAGLADNEAAEFWRHCGYVECRREVTRAINRRAGDGAERDETQVELLPGYEHLHAYYVVRRGNEDMGVSVFALTDAEILGKQAHYRAMGSACFEHARELERFRISRGITIAADD